MYYDIKEDKFPPGPRWTDKDFKTIPLGNPPPGARGHWAGEADFE